MKTDINALCGFNNCQREAASVIYGAAFLICKKGGDTGQGALNAAYMPEM